MPRVIRCGLIQASNPRHEGSLQEIKEAMVQKHIPLIEDAGKKGVQILCLQEIFHGPYFPAEQDIKWYKTAEPVPGPLTERLAPIAKKFRMVMIVPVYEMEQEGVYFNTAAVLDADGRYLGKMRKVHIPHTYPAFWEKFYFKPGTLGFPVFQTAYAKIGIYICYDRHFPECARILALKGAEILFNPSATTEGKSRYLWELEQPGSGGGQRSLHRSQQQGWTRKAVGVRQVLRVELLRRPARQDPGQGLGGQGRGRGFRSRPGPDPRGA